MKENNELLFLKELVSKTNNETDKVIVKLIEIKNRPTAVKLIELSEKKFTIMTIENQSSINEVKTKLFEICADGTIEFTPSNINAYLTKKESL